MFMYYMHAVPEETRRGPQIPLELEVEMTVSHYVGAGIQVLCKISQCS